VIRASIDGFHNPQEVRYESGRDSAQGYYHDSFDYEAVKSSLLIPLGPDGDCQYVAAKFDFRSDCRVKPPVCSAERDSILLFDGIFLLRPELYDYWDFCIFVDIDYDVSIRRASVRDQELFGTPEALRQRYHQRYVPGQQIYMESVRPLDKADVIVRNNDFDNPTIEICGQDRSDFSRG
jgi:uridine kinase